MFSQSFSDVVPTSLSPKNSSVLTVPEGCVLKQVSEFVPWDNEHNLIPKQVDVIVNIMCAGILMPLLFLMSVSTNVVNMVVFYKHGLKERINMCLFTLSLVDMLYVAAVYGYNSDVLYMFVLGKGDELGPSAIFFLQHYLLGLSGLTTSSQIVSSVVALERCLCIIRPLLVKTLISTKTTAMLLWSLLVLITGGVFVISGMRYTVICVFDMRYNRTSFHLYPTEFYFQNLYIMHIFSGIIYGSVLPVLCGICVTVCTVVTVIKMKKLSQWRETVSSASDSLTSRDLAVTRMIVGTSVHFIVCIVPSIAVRASVILVPELKAGGRYDNLYSVFTRFFMFTSMVNSSFNFFVYYVYGTKFRQTVCKLFSMVFNRKSKMQNTHK